MQLALRLEPQAIERAFDMFKLDEFLRVVVPPADQNLLWMQGASSAVEYLVSNAQSNQVILFTNAGQSFVQTALVPLPNVTPPDGDELQHAYLNLCDQWAINYVTGGGEPDKIYLASPINRFGCKSFDGGQQLVFRRQFLGVDKGAPRTEIAQPLVQALDLYWLDERSAYCRLNEDGDVEPIIRLDDLSTKIRGTGSMLVTIEAEQLHRYMAVTDMALIVKFDFTRYRTGAFNGWGDGIREQIEEDDLYYHRGIETDASFANGVIILRPSLTKEKLIEKAKRSWNDPDKQYAIFKALDWKNQKLAEVSCAPTALASYFEKDSPLPFQVTPAFFKAEVLQKYKADPDKYTLDNRSIHARGGWYLKSYDVNEAGQIHAYLYDLANLPYTEQLYWQSFNEWPKGGISERAHQTDIQGKFSTVRDPLDALKSAVSRLDDLKPKWWQPRGEGSLSMLHYPVTASSEEWSNALLFLDQFVVEGFVTKELRAKLEIAGRIVDKQWGTLRLLQDCLVLAGLEEAQAIAVIEPLKRTHALRSVVKGHLAESKKQAEIKKAYSDHGSLAAHFRKLTEDVRRSFNQIVKLL